jgi:uncharacterized protein
MPLLLFLLTLVVGLAPQLEAQTLPNPVGRINDFAELLDAEAEQTLAAAIEQAEKESSAQMAIATVTSLDGASIEEYATRLFNQWGIGQRTVNNGVLVLVAPNEREVRIEVGYGLEPILPDGLAGAIIRDDFLPLFREGKYQEGIVRGGTRVAEVVRKQHRLTDEERRLLSIRPPDAADYAIAGIIGILVSAAGLAAGASARQKQAQPILATAIISALLVPFSQLIVPGSGWVTGPAFLLMALLGYTKLKTAFSRGGRRKGSRGWDWGSSSSGSGSAGGGSFGGGSSGGGGASGRW